ncbi:hypothetical protein HMPREF1869_00663 [Bacteroidales bacterium KA00251]|nr:hypothetical protein HMPREF1869_00663 [Bacteroidales bacterium KA00251]
MEASPTPELIAKGEKGWRKERLTSLVVRKAFPHHATISRPLCGQFLRISSRRLLLLVTILSQSFLSFMRRHLMSLSFLSARHSNMNYV